MVECSDKSIYTGITSDINKRMDSHNSGKGSKYVRARLPISLKWESDEMSKSSALKEEYRIKQLSRKNKIKMINESLYHRCMSFGLIKHGRQT
jgi:putative endonuclease